MDAGAFGCLGVGVPFAIAAALALPGRPVVSSMAMVRSASMRWKSTPVRHGAKVVFVVSNNAAWNIERLDQEMNYGGRVVGTTLRHSDYAGLARALGAYGERVERPRPSGRSPACAAKCLCGDRRRDITIGAVVGRAESSGFVPDYQALTIWDEAEREAARSPLRPAKPFVEFPVHNLAHLAPPLHCSKQSRRSDTFLEIATPVFCTARHRRAAPLRRSARASGAHDSFHTAAQ